MDKNLNYTYKFLEINSKDYVYGSHASFNINLPYSIPIKRIELLNAQIPNSFFNITDDNNSMIVNGVLIKIQNGSYDYTQFRNYFISAFSDFALDLEYYDTLQQVLLSSPSAVTISFPQFGSLHSVLGFDKNYSKNDIAHWSNSAIMLQDNFIHIKIDEFGNNILIANSVVHSGTFAIPNTANKGDFIYFNQHTNYCQFINSLHCVEPIFNLNISLTNSNGSQLINVAPWSCLLLICF